MVAVTYDVVRGAAPAVADTKAGNRSKGLFMRVFDAIAESQMKRAERELARHRHLLPRGFELGGTKLWSRSEDEPFGGW